MDTNVQVHVYVRAPPLVLGSQSHEQKDFGVAARACGSRKLFRVSLRIV